MHVVAVQLVAAVILAMRGDTVRTCGQPAVSPDGEHIAYICNRDGVDNVYVAPTRGTDERQLTSSGMSGNTPRWTSDGRAVLFSGARADSGRVFSVSKDGTGCREVASIPGRGPALSPDGARVLYSVGSWTSTRLVVSNVDGSNAHPITDASATAWNGVWSPDGTRIAYTRGDSLRVLSIWIVGSAGTAPHEVARSLRPDEVVEVPAWSSDGRRLAFQMSNRKTHSAHVGIGDVGGGDARVLAASNQAHSDETPQWFPDGRRIAFQSNRSGRMQVWIMNSDGTGIRQFSR